jgi:hypothetical protein
MAAVRRGISSNSRSREFQLCVIRICVELYWTESSIMNTSVTQETIVPVIYTPIACVPATESSECSRDSRILRKRSWDLQKSIHLHSRKVKVIKLVSTRFRVTLQNNASSGLPGRG